MGSVGSTEQTEDNKQDTNKIQNNLVCRFTINESNTNPEKKTSTMDINDIIGMPSETGSESTLESEIDALSKIITDTKDGSLQKLEENDEDFKLDNDDLSFTASFPCDSENDKCDSLPDDGSIMKDILDSSKEIDKFISTSESHTQAAVLDDVSKSSNGAQENEKSDDALNDQKVIEVVLGSPKSTDQDVAIELSGVQDNSLLLINQESQSCLDSQTVSALETQQIINSENKTDNTDENILESVKTHNVASDVNETESISNLPTENRELDTKFKDNLDTDSTDLKITDLEKNKDEQTTENASDNDQPDLVNVVTDIQNVVDVGILQQKEEDVNTSPSDANKELQENVTEETLMEVDNENEAKESNIEQKKMLDEGARCTEIIKTQENIMVNPINKAEQTVSRATEAEVTVESGIEMAAIINPSEIKQTEINSSLEISEEASKVSLTENQTMDQIWNTENHFSKHESQITNNADTNVSHSKLAKIDIKESIELGGSNSSSSTITDELNKEKLKADTTCSEDSKQDSDNKQNKEILEIPNVTAAAQDGKTDQETATHSDLHHQDLHKETVIENINISEQTVATNETLQNIVTDIIIKDSQIVESITEKVQSENDDSKLNSDDPIVDSNTASSDDKNELEDTNEKEPVAEKLFSRAETDDRADECIVTQGTENTKETVNNLVESSPNQIIVLNIAETCTDNSQQVTHAIELNPVKEPLQNIASTDEIQEDEMLELDEPETLNNTDLIESKENVKDSKKDKIKTVVTEQIFQENAEHEETEDPVEINLSLDPDSSPISHDVFEEQMVTDPLDKFVENIIDNKSSEESKAIQTAPSDDTNANENIDETLDNDQVLDSQELASCALHKVEKDSGLDVIVDTEEESSNKETAHFAHSETSNLPDRDFQSLDEKSQDSLSILNALQTESISIDQEKENNKFESAGKEDEISLMFDESSQSSPRHAESDKFVNDLYKNCVPDDTIDGSNDAPVENIEEFSKPSSINEQNVEIHKEMKQDTTNVGLESGAQSNDVEVPETRLNTKASVEDSAEISELESAVKFLQESEEQDIQNSRIVQDNNINEGNSSIFVAVDDSICDNTSELVSDQLPEITLDPIAISEAEIISEAAKLENERKEKLQLDHQLKSSEQESSELGNVDITESHAIPSTDNLLAAIELTKPLDALSEVSSMDTCKVPLIRQRKLTPGVLPEASLLDERYKEPPKIEIPEISPPLPSTPRASLLIQKDAKQRLESPDRLSVYHEPKITDTPKKDSDKQQQQYPESENMGSPRIILKIAKSAIAECSEPRSPKSPKIRSAANSPNPDDSPGQKLGKIKLKLSKGGHPSIIPNNDEETAQWHTDSPSSASPLLGMKIKLSKSGDASVVQQESSRGHDEMQKLEEGYKPEMPIGMKIKLSKSGDASIVQHDTKESIEGKVRQHKDAKESAQEASSTKKQDSPSIGMKIKLSKSGDASIIQQDVEEMQDSGRRTTDSPIGMKIKLSKSGDASVVSNEHPEDTSDKTEEPFKRTDSPMGVRIKLAKTKSGNASIISSETIEESENAKKIKETEALGEESAKAGIGMKIKLSKSGDASVIRDDSSSMEPSRKSGELPIGMKIKLSKTGEPSIIHTDISKKSHSDGLIESTKNQPTHTDTAMMDLHNKRKEITISPVESKKTKMDANLKQMLPDITIQPIASPVQKKDQQKLMLDPNASNISRQQMNVINQEISITQICSLSTGDTGDCLKNALNAQPSSCSPLNSDCEIIEPQPELIIVNENSNSSQDIMIIDEVPSLKSLVKVPKKRGRPRRNAVAASVVNVNMSSSSFQEQFEMQRDPLSLDQPPLPMFQQQIHERMNLHQFQHQLPAGASESSERPRRTCRSQKSYAPPKRGRGRGRGKRKSDTTDISVKKQRIEQDLTAIENATTAVITLEKLPIETSPELFRALNQPTLERIIGTSKPTERNVEFGEIPDNARTCTLFPHQKKIQAEIHLPEDVAEELEISKVPAAASRLSTDACLPPISEKEVVEIEEADQLMEKSDTISIKVTEEEDKQQNEIVLLSEQTEMTPSRSDPSGQQHQNWLAPSIRKVSIESTATRTESTMSTLTVIDEETRMSAESCSRSQTPARNISVPGTSEAVLVNEESQGSTATTESEKVKVKIRRMEINLDPADEGPFTVEKIAEYEWPPPRDDEARPAATRAETFMIQEQISQYLGVKSFKRKYPDLKRRMVDMEERNFLRENGLVSESMCDMGLTAVSSSEVLDIMCSDFPEQYEEYRKHMREKAAKEHSKKQKELSAAANAERNRIDLAEMAMQSALNWNVGLNKARRESRRCSLDLQTFTVHMPKRAIKIDPSKRGSHYPVALIPGQYTDYYREYTPAELRYYPLNTVLYGPMRPNERKFDSQSEGSQSDSDSDSSSDDSSSSSSEGTQDTEGSQQSTMDEVDMELAIQSDVKCKICLNHLNKSNRPEVLIQCGTCAGNVHPSCIDLTLDMVPHIRAYAWQCTDCKTCAQCHDPADEDKMLFCDMCDRGYHIYCVGLRRVPQGRWHCQECAVCANCGSKEPGGANSDRNSVAQWQHEYKKADKNTRVYVSTFCVPCSKLWRKGRYCPHCSRCHNAPRLDLEPNLVHCGACDKYLHLGCVETKGLIIDKKNYLCEFCSPNRQTLVKPLISKTFKT